MNRSTTPGLGQWLTVSVIVILVLFLLYKLLQYSNFRQNYPAGLTMAGVNVGGYTREQAEQILIDRYINAPIVLYHGENRVEINPLQVEFQLDMETMFVAAEFEKEQQDYWSGFWGFLTGRPVEIGDVPLTATHDQEALVSILTQVATNYDSPAQPAQPVPGTFSFQYGESGLETAIDASLTDVTAALYRPTDREAYLTVSVTEAQRPEINLLARLLVNSTQEFEQSSGGAASVFIIDLATGDEIAINSRLPMSGMGLLKLPIALTAYQVLPDPISEQQAALIADALLSQEDGAANTLLALISGTEDAQQGTALVTETMQALGLANTFIAAPYGEEVPRGAAVETPANSAEILATSPSPAMQTTAEDLGTLLSMLHFCATAYEGALPLAFGEDLTQAECTALVDILTANSIDSLIEQGVPQAARVAHRHGWIEDTHGDAGIIYTDNGAYVLVEIMFKPTWLEWEISSPLMANISRATYNFFNFDAPFLDTTRSN